MALPAVLAAWSFWRPTLDVFNTTKATVVVLGSVVSAAFLATAVAADRRARPSGPWPRAVALFAVAVGVAWVAGGAGAWELVGAPGRHGGAALYWACAVVGLAASTLDARGRRGAVDALVWSSLPVSAYALLQWLGADPLDWVAVEGGAPVFSTFGNVDFASAWLGVVGALALPTAIGSRGGAAGGGAAGTARRRVVAAVAVTAAALAALATGSLQGPVILLVAGLGATAHRWRGDRTRLLALAGVVVMAGLLLLGPARPVLDGAARSLDTRTSKWTAALAIAADAPLRGRGLDRYEDWFFAARTADVAEDSGLRRSVDNAHNVPLHLLTGGGPLLALAWLAALVVVPAWGLWRARDRLEDPVLLGLALAWAGYLLQAMVSLDVPPLAALGWTIAGLLAGATGGPPDGAGARPGGEVAGARPVGGTRSVVVVVVAVALALAVAATVPWRADAVGWDAEMARVSGDLAAAEALTERAGALAPWDSRYAANQGGWLTGVGLLEDALRHQTEARRRRPRSLSHALNVARLLTALERPDQAQEAYRRVLEIDPFTPAVLEEAAAAGADVQ